jgi:hypothetical protein
MRLSPRLDALVSEEARRTRRSKGAIVEGLAEEALRMRLFPGIAFRGADWERRPWVIGTAFDVWQVVDAYRDYDSVGAMAREGALTEAQIRLALAYRERFPDEVDADVEANRRALSDLRSEFPFVDVRGQAPE